MFAQLIANSSNAQSLSKYIGSNQLLIYEFANSSIDIQRQEEGLFRQFVLLGARVQMLDSLDFTQSSNRAFISILFDYAERINAIAAAVQLYQIIQRHHLEVGSRLEATMLYLYNIPNNQVYVDRLDDICTKLQTAINEEDDDDKRAVATFLNYYSTVVYNTAPHAQFVHDILSKVNALTNTYRFLQNEDVANSLLLDISQPETVYSTIQATIDRLLGKERILTAIPNEEVIIEKNTDYAQLLSSCQRRFSCIRDIAVFKLADMKNSDEVFRSLGRGVAILEQEEQLYSYLKSYGLMHKAKLLSSFSSFPFNEVEGRYVEIYDWSCGQALATIVLLEYLGERNVDLNIDGVTLIEPSEIALKRAALHVKHFAPEVRIKTVHKDMDSLEIADISGLDEVVKIHLFSNILDVETYSMRHLIEIMKQGVKGNNYMVCVSPYISDIKTARFDSFVDSFNMMPQFRLLYQDVALRGEWSNNWTKLIKTFKVVL